MNTVQPRTLGVTPLPVSLPTLGGVLALPERSPEILSKASEDLLDGAAVTLRPTADAPPVPLSLSEPSVVYGPDFAFMGGIGESTFQPAARSTSPQWSTPRQAAVSDLPARTGTAFADQAGEPTGVPPATSGWHFAGGASTSSSAGHGSSAVGMLPQTQFPPARAITAPRTRPAKASTASAPDVPVPVPE